MLVESSVYAYIISLADTYKYHYMYEIYIYIQQRPCCIRNAFRKLKITWIYIIYFFCTGLIRILLLYFEWVCFFIATRKTRKNVVLIANCEFVYGLWKGWAGGRYEYPSIQ